MSKRFYLAGIGSPEWQARTASRVNSRGVPIPVRPGSNYVKGSCPAPYCGLGDPHRGGHKVVLTNGGAR